MKPIVVSRTIQAPVEVVFRTISDVRNFSKAVPQIINIEFLSEHSSGIGTRFRETRLMNGKEQTVDLEVVDLVPNQHVRIVSDAGGTLWDSLFSTSSNGDCTELTLQMDIRPHHVFARVMNMMIRGVVENAIVRDMDAVKTYCESERSNEVM